VTGTSRADRTVPATRGADPDTRPGAGPDGHHARRNRRVDWGAVRTVMRKDVTAVRRSKPIVLPMLLVPLVLILALPVSIGLLAANAPTDAVASALSSPMLEHLADPILELPERERLVVLVLGYLLSPLLLVIPLMVSAVLAADAFAGEKERRTLETLLHLPVPDRDLFLAKVLGAFVPAVVLTWASALGYLVVANAVAWPTLGRLFLPFAQWTVMVVWVAPAVGLLALGLLVIVSSRARTTQEANQLGGAVILPLIFLAAAQASALLLAPVPLVLAAGALVWVLAGALVGLSARRFTRDRMATAA
jgi:ABC-type transport system involved in multi-copper enzyme maturation permease subunit